MPDLAPVWVLAVIGLGFFASGLLLGLLIEPGWSWLSRREHHDFTGDQF